MIMAAMTILEKFLQTIKRYDLFSRGDSVLVAFSGGADSTVLLSLLLEIRDKWDLDLCLGHFNHGLRKQSDEDEALVKETGQLLGLPVYTEGADVKAYSFEFGLNLEEAGRVLRYEFLEKTARKIKAQKIVTGHTQTDQAETFLIRLMRGSGRKGLSGIFPVVEGKIVRPLLGIEREEIEKYIVEKSLSFRVDESNLNKRFLRNRIRLELIPLLKKQYDPQIVTHLANTALLLQDEEVLLTRMTGDAAAEAIRTGDGEAYLDVVKLSKLPRAISRRVIRIFIENIKGDLRAISLHDVETIRELKEGKKAHLKKDLVLIRERNRIRLLREKDRRIEYSYSWDGKDLINIQEINLQFFADQIQKDKFTRKFDDLQGVMLDRDTLRFPLIVRNRQEGDRYHPCGAPGSKKIKEIFRARSIPPSARDKHPIFISGGEIVWVLGLPVSEKHKITDSTNTIFIIRCIH
jgi:tRNA(Ile)-lysidine synthase